MTAIAARQIVVRMMGLLCGLWPSGLQFVGEPGVNLLVISCLIYRVVMIGYVPPVGGIVSLPLLGFLLGGLTLLPDVFPTRGEKRLMAEFLQSRGSLLGRYPHNPRQSLWRLNIAGGAQTG